MSRFASAGLVVLVGLPSIALADAFVCESEGAGSEICAMIIDAKAQPKAPAVRNSAKPTSSRKSSGLVTKDELSGGAVDLENEYDADVLADDKPVIGLGDRAPVPSALADAIKTQNRVRSVEAFLESAPANGPGLGGITVGKPTE